VSELKTLVAATRRLEQNGESFLLATVVRTHGASYRHEGARLIIDRDGRGTGSISGGCLEADLQRRGWWRTEGHGPVVLTYDSRPEEGDDEVGWGLGLGCQGAVELLLETIAPGMPIHPLRFIEGCLEKGQRGAIATVFRSDCPEVPLGARLTRDAHGEILCDIVIPGIRSALAAVAEKVLSTGRTLCHVHDCHGGSIEALVDVIVPPPHLWLFGVGPDAVSVLTMARSIGWTLSICGRQARWQTRERFASADHLYLGPIEAAAAACGACDQSFAIVMSHDYEQDRGTLRALLSTPVRYIGVLGPRQRTLRLLADLKRAGWVPTRADAHRLHAPIGLDLGAETSHEIVLAVISEIQAVRAGASAAFLRNRFGRIHSNSARTQEGPFVPEESSPFEGDLSCLLASPAMADQSL